MQTVNIRRLRAPGSLTATLLGTLLLLGGCMYRMPVRQGNYIDPAIIAQIKIGMTRSQVRYLLGTPMIPDSFDSTRWDYDYFLKNKKLRSPKRSHVTVYFANELVTRVDSTAKEAPGPELLVR